MNEDTSEEKSKHASKSMEGDVKSRNWRFLFDNLKR